MLSRSITYFWKSAQDKRYQCPPLPADKRRRRAVSLWRQVCHTGGNASTLQRDGCVPRCSVLGEQRVYSLQRTQSVLSYVSNTMLLLTDVTRYLSAFGQIWIGLFFTPPTLPPSHPLHPPSLPLFRMSLRNWKIFEVLFKDCRLPHASFSAFLVRNMNFVHRRYRLWLLCYCTDVTVSRQCLSALPRAV